MARRRIEVVAAVIRDNEGRIFATQRGYGAMKDGWEFPGGKMEAGDIVASREKATESIAGEIVRRLTPHGINVTLVNITNIDYSDAFEKAVEEKQVALQKSIKDEERDRPSARGRGAGGRQGGGRG